MKKPLFLIIVFSLLLLSCQTASKSESERNATGVIEKSLSLNDFAESFGGVWIPKAYLDTIIKHKSAYLSRHDIPFISGLKIHKNNLKKDTLSVPSGINNHEGYYFKVWKSNQTEKPEYANSLLEWEESLDFIFSYNTADTSISIVVKNENDSLVERTDYVRVLSHEYAFDHNESAYDYIGRKFILNGRYQILDSTGKDLGIAEFEPATGGITGFKYSYYTIATDFIGGPVYPSDYIILRPALGIYSGQRFLSMIQRNDTICLHETVETETDTAYKVELGKVNYFLIDKN